MEYLRPIETASPEFAAHYDELPLWSAPFGSMLLQAVPIRSGITALDVGAGTGFLSIELAERCGPEAHVIAVDPWLQGLAQLRGRVQRLGLHNVTILEGDVASVPIADESVDLAVSNLGLNNFADPTGSLRACHRACRPGADLLLTTNVRGHMTEFYDAFGEVLSELDLSDCIDALEEHVAHRGTRESVCGLLDEGGFEVHEVQEESFSMRFGDGSALLRHHLIRLGFMPDWKAICPAERVEPVFTHLETNLNARAKRDGALELTIPALLVRGVRV